MDSSVAPAQPEPSNSNQHPIKEHEGFSALLGRTQCALNQTPEPETGDPWDRKIILSLDGGGMRGFASLLILERLMAKIKTLETRDSLVGSAAYPWCSMPDGQVGATIGSQPDFRPHHYFDYFVGTSTGGLSAIMLGRLQWTIKEAKDQYSIVGKEVFQNPHFGTLKGLLRPRYNDKRMEKVLQEATQRDISHRFLRVPTGFTSDVVQFKANKLILRADNHDAARTAVVAQGLVEGTRQPYIFRSYDHPQPNYVGSRDKSRKNPWNPGPASHLPIWQVGRATSAAPTYFGPMRVGEEEFKDGGVAGQNNPVALAYHEVVQMHPSHKPALIISIGTGKKSGAPREAKWYSGVLGKHFQGIFAEGKQFQDQVLDSHQQHVDFSDVIDKINEGTDTESVKVRYDRFDVPEKYNITKNKLDHWKGKDGAETKQDLSESVNSYCEENSDLLDRCAERLVEVRRSRARTERWERFAMHLVYSCPLRQREERNGDGGRLCKSNPFETRDELRQHAIASHGLALQVQCSDAAGSLLGSWVCDRGSCKSNIRVFGNRNLFKAHLFEGHQMSSEVNRVQTNAEFEAWLDEGRQARYGAETNQRAATSTYV